MDGRPTASGTWNTPRCEHCSKPVTRDEIGLSKKLINRATTVFWCADCLAKRLGTTKEALLLRARELKAMGCTLF